MVGGDSSKPTSRVSAIRVSAVGKGVHDAVSVSDRGRGIPAESLPHLFRKFSRPDGGDGGGSIVDSGLGAKFTFALPGVEEAGFVQTESAQPLSRSGRSGRNRIRVLTVDDDLQALRYVCDTLMKSGYEPLVTADPEEALRPVEEEKPQLVPLDLVLPGTDGIDLMRDIMERRDVPVIFLSAYGQDKLVARALTWGLPTTCSSPSRRWSCRPGSGPRCAGARPLSHRSPMSWAI